MIVFDTYLGGLAALILVILMIRANYFNLISIINSHLGNNLSTSEADNKSSASTIKNLASRLYSDQIEEYYKNSPFTRNVEPSKIPSIHVSELTIDKFVELSKNFTHPFVVKGFLKDCAATKWDLDFFKNRYGETKLPVIKDAGIAEHKKYISSSSLCEHEYIKMSDFIDAVKNGNKLYINNISRIFGYHPELLNDMNLEDVKKYAGIDLKDEIHVTNLFIGGQGTGTSLHCSITGNFFYNVRGNKKWYLIDPAYSQYMRPKLSRTGLFAVSLIDICGAKPGDYALNIPRYEVVLEEGDMLFNPPWWWHAITNTTDYTIACANRFTNFWAGFKNNPLFTTIFMSHPISNYTDFSSGVKTTAEANIMFDKALLADILKSNKKLE